MGLDAILAYLHFTSIFVLFAFLSIQAVLLKDSLDTARVRLVGRMDMWYFGSAFAALVTGFLRAGFGAKGPDFYFSAWPIYLKIALFVAIGVISIKPTLAFIRWRRESEHDAAWRVPDAERKRMRGLVILEVHLAAMIPLVAVFMARGAGH